jgi:small-conductance mechanosensitive channel
MIKDIFGMFRMVVILASVVSLGLVVAGLPAISGDILEEFVSANFYIVRGQGDGIEPQESSSVEPTDLDSIEEEEQQQQQREDRMNISSNNFTSQDAKSDSANGANYYFNSILSVIITVAGSLVVYLVTRYFLQRTADSLQLDRRELKGIFSVVKLILIVISVTIIVFQFSSVSGIAASAISVAAGTIIGFSSRNTISNAIAGILLLSARPFKLGDRIRTTEDEDLVGDVVEIALLYTKIRTIRNELVAIPNQTLLQRQIINYSGLEILSIKIELALTYDKDRELIEKLLIDCAVNTAGILQHPKSPYVMLTGLEKYAANYELRAFTNKPNEFLKIQSEIRKKIYDTFHSQGIDLTVPQLQETSSSENSSTKLD